jgi:hypothetical protein
MIIGNITLSSRPKDYDYKVGICAGCLEEAEERPFDDSFSDQFGNVEQWSVGSSCCGTEIFEGKIFLDKTSTHIANKDHFAPNDKLIVKKGERYKSRIIKGYYIDGGESRGIFRVEKRKI